MKAGRLEERLAALSGMSKAQLRQEWERVHRAPAPQAFVADLLARGIAWTLQQRVYGGLSAASRKAVMAGTNRQRDGDRKASAPRLRAGSRLAREWGGRTHHVIVTDHGFVYHDRSYRSLSQVAQLITGAKWSGPRFFGLKASTNQRADGGRNVAA